MLANTTLSLVTGNTEILTEESAAENMRRNSSSVTSLSASTSVCASTPSSFSAALRGDLAFVKQPQRLLLTGKLLGFFPQRGQLRQTAHAVGKAAYRSLFGRLEAFVKAVEFFTEAFRAGAICVPLEALEAVVVEGNVVFKTEIFKIVDVLVHRGRFGGKIAAEQRVFDETQHFPLSAVVFAQREVVGDESGVGVRRQHVLPVAEIGNVKLPEHRADRVVVLVYVAW